MTVEQIHAADRAVPYVASQTRRKQISAKPIGQNGSGMIFTSSIGTAIKRLESFGLLADDLLEGTGLSKETVAPELSSAEVVSGDALLGVFDNALNLSGNPELGLCYGEAADVAVYGPVGFAMLSASTDIEAVNIAIKYQKIHFGTLANISLLLEEGHGVIRLSESLPVGCARVFFIEMLLSGFLRFNTVLAGRPTRLSEVRLTYSDPGYKHKYEELFNCEVHFNCQHHELIFDTGILAIELPNADKMTAAACERICADLLVQFNRGEAISAEVRRHLAENVQELPDMKSLAKRLCCDERTLRRRLSAENTSYQELKDQVRRDVAIEFLSTTDLSVRDIARRLGFQETSNFRRAFRKWTGDYPSVYRQENTSVNA